MTKSKTSPASYSSATVKKLEKSLVEISATIPAETWATFRTEALRNINSSITVDGFRKGMVPENILIAKVGDMTILQEMADLALTKAYVDILVDNKIDAIGKPRVSLTKIAAGNPLEFKATTATVPEVTLPEYKKLAAEQISKSSTDELKVTDADIEEAILRVRKSRVSHEGHNHENMTPEEHDKAVEAALPELTDDFVKTLGNFTDIPDFKVKLSGMIAEQKKDEAREKLRLRIADAVSDATTIDLPEILVESELNRMQAQFEADIERMNVKLEDYLTHAKKTIAEIHTEWRPHAEKKAKLQLILNAVARTEKITPSQKEIDAEVDHIVEHYKDADRERAAVYAETVLTNEKVFQFLEKAAQ